MFPNLPERLKIKELCYGMVRLPKWRLTRNVPASNAASITDQATGNLGFHVGSNLFDTWSLFEEDLSNMKYLEAASRVYQFPYLNHMDARPVVRTCHHVADRLESAEPSLSSVASSRSS